MKISITGKGGVGKTTLASLLCYLYSSEGKKVIAVDADPDANLASAIGVPRDEIAKIKPIAEMADLVEERTGAKPGTSGGIFKINPKVDDIPEGFGYRLDGILLLEMGKSKFAASGCYCPEHALLRRLLKHLIVERDEIVIIDMEAGIEHLTRGTAEAVDAFVVVVEPGQRSLQTASAVKKLATELGVRKVFVVANKIRNREDLEFIRNNLHTDMKLLGKISLSAGIVEADISGLASYEGSPEVIEEVGVIKENLERAI